MRQNGYVQLGSILNPNFQVPNKGWTVLIQIGSTKHKKTNELVKNIEASKRERKWARARER